MIKLISMLAVLTLILGVCVCASAEDKTYTVGILQLIQHPALDLATQGFKDALTEKLGGTVVFDEGNASGDSSNCAQIAGRLVSKNVDLIMANATPAMLACATATADIPVLLEKAASLGLAEISRRSRDDWALLVLQKES